MKKLIAFLLCLPALYVFAQDTLYLDKNRVRIEDASLAHYYQVTQNDVKGENTRVVRIYDMSGQIRLKKNMKKPDFNKKTDKQPFGRETIHYEKMYDRDFLVLDGEVFSWWENGQLRRHDVFKQHDFVEGQCWDEQGNEIDHYPFLIQPSFPGGVEKLMDYLARNLRYPPRARNRNITGIVFVNFIVERDGSISKAQVVSNTHRLLNNEALRVVESMPDWEPGFEDDFPIRVSFNLPIRFLLN